MARYAFDRLTALDNSFLALENHNAYMHVASTMTFDAGPLRHADGGIDAEALKQLIAGCLPMIPRYRQRLAWTPLYRNPVWIDDDRFSIDFHVRHTSLPAPAMHDSSSGCPRGSWSTTSIVGDRCGRCGLSRASRTIDSR